MNKITLSAASCAFSAMTLLATGCVQESPEQVPEQVALRKIESSLKSLPNTVSNYAESTSEVTTGKRSSATVTPPQTHRLYEETSSPIANADLAKPQLSGLVSGSQHTNDLSIGREVAAFQPDNAEQETYAELGKNATIKTHEQSVSTFSIDVDTGAYSNVRRFLQNGMLPPVDAVRVEELINYFSYNYADAAQLDDPFSVTTMLGSSPWNDKTRLLHIGLKGFIPPTRVGSSANLVFLLDVSGSMNSPDKLGLLKSSISMLSRQLTASDSVSIVVYAGSSGTVLDPTPGNQYQKIDQALAKLNAGGSTNGAQGIELAYQLASNNFRENGINRVILATDGDFNVGISDIETLKDIIARKRESGIALTTLGFGRGNYNDHLMEQLADIGNGSYAYIDNLGEARKVLVDELQATLLTIASDVKIQVEFNPAVVSEYRLIGYTNRQLANEDFNDDRVDAGEIGAGHTVTALYEIALKGEGGERHSPSRYQSEPNTRAAGMTGSEKSYQNEIAELRLRYKQPGSTKSRLISHVVNLSEQQATQTDTRETVSSDSSKEPVKSETMPKDTIVAKPKQYTNLSADNNADFRFSASVAAFGQLLRGDSRMASFGYQDARRLAADSLGDDNFGYRAEYLRLLDLADTLTRLGQSESTPIVSDES